MRLQASLNSTDDVEELGAIARAGRTRSYGMVQTSAHLKAVRVRKDTAAALPGLTENLSRLRCETSAFVLESNWDGRAIGRYNQQKAMIEWKSVTAELSFHDRKERTFKIASLLCEVNNTKPRDLIILKCLGAMVSDGAQPMMGLVYSIPSPSNGSNPINLFEILVRHRTHGIIARWPALEARRRLACSLARAVFQLHVVGWLHKSIRPHNVVFFGNTDTLESPYLIGFDYARQDDIREKSERPDPTFGLYRHPDAQGDARKR